MRRIVPLSLSALCLVLAYACTCGGVLGPPCPTPGPTPTPTPTPTPGPTPTPPPTMPPRDVYVFPEGLIRVDGPGPRITRGGHPHTFRGFSQCCDATVIPDSPTVGARGRQSIRKPKPLHINRRVIRELDQHGNPIRVAGKPKLRVELGSVPNSRWPFMSVPVQNYVAGFGANRNQSRDAPYRGDVDHETEWADIGGPINSDGSFNQPWWDEERMLTFHWGTLGGSTEHVFDSWWLKWCIQNDVTACMWPEADVRAFGHQLTAKHVAFLDKMVEEFGCMGNVTWGVGNEEALVPGAKPEFYAQLADEFRAAEGRHPCKDQQGKPIVVVHAISNNAPQWAGYGAYDLATTHARQPLVTPLYGTRPSELNEFNPGWPPQEWFANYCKAQAAGLSVWLWRNGSTDLELEQMLSLMGRGCGAVPEQCFVPAADDPNWGANVLCGGRMRPYLEDAKQIVGSRCGVSHDEMYQTNALLAAEIRKMRDGETGHVVCASGPWADATAIYDELGQVTEEHHAVAYTDGCYTSNPAVLPKFCWYYNGPPIQPPNTACDIDPGVIDRIDLKILQPTTYLYDGTPKVHGNPVLPEGDPRRSACEVKAGGGTPTFTVEGAGLSLAFLDNPYQFKLKGAGVGVVHCTLPNSAPTDLCRSFPVSR